MATTSDAHATVIALNAIILAIFFVRSSRHRSSVFRFARSVSFNGNQCSDGSELFRAFDFVIYRLAIVEL